MKIKNRTLFYIGLAILVLLLASLLIKFPVESGYNFNTSTSLLGILIFYNPAILVVYILIAIFLIYKGLGIKIKLA